MVEMAISIPYYLLPGESREEYESLATAYEREFAPATEHESFLVNLLIESRWKIQRFERLLAEAANQVFVAGEVKALSPDAALVDALVQPNSVYEKLQRYVSQFERAYQRAWNQLIQARRERARAACDEFNSRLDAIMNDPLPPPENEPVQNEPNRAPDVPRPVRRLADPEALPEPVILDSAWYEPGSHSR